MAKPKGGSWYQWNFISRMVVLLLVPTLFRWLNIAFIWHSIYWGTITIAILLWGGFILLSPLLGRLSCGCLCFFGTLKIWLMNMRSSRSGMENLSGGFNLFYSFPYWAPQEYSTTSM